jgi:hypothetical protein
MAGFQLVGPAADVSKILYGESRKSYQSPNAQYNNFLLSIVAAANAGIWERTNSRKNILDHDATVRNRAELKLSYCAFGLWYDWRISQYNILDTSAAGPAS